MKRLAICFLTLLGASLPGAAQGLSVEDARAGIIAFHARISRISCDFVQTKTSPLLAAPAVSTGHLRYGRPDSLEWRYDTPFSLAFVADGAQLFVEKDGVRTPVSGQQGRLVREMTSLIIKNLAGSILSDEQAFRVEFSVSSGDVTAVLYPQKKEMRQLWEKFILHYDPDTLCATRFDMYESAGDLTVIAFSHVRYDFSE